MYKRKIESVDYSSLIQELENNTWVILYKKYKSYSPEYYDSLIRDWDLYYKIAWEDSPMGHLYHESKRAWIAGRMDICKRNAPIATEWLKNGKRLPTPSEEDPRLIERRSPVQTYLNLKRVSDSKLSTSFII